MIRKKKLLRIAFRDLKRNKLQFIALVILMAFGVASFNTLFIGYLNLGYTYNHAYNDYNLADRWIQAYQATHEMINAADAHTVMKQIQERFPGAIKNYEVRLFYDMPINISLKDGSYVLIRGRIIGYNVTNGRVPTVNTIKVINGRYFVDSDRWNPQNPQLNVIVDQHLYDYYKFTLPTTVIVNAPAVTTELQIVGSAGSPEYPLVSLGWNDMLPSSRRVGIFYAPLSTVQYLVGVSTDKINEIVLTFSSVLSKEQKDQITDKIVRLLEDKGYNLESPIDRKKWTPVEALRLDYEGFAEIASAFPTLIFVVALIGVYIAINRMVVVQRKEIGVSRALGYSRRDIILRYVLFVSMISITGSIIGAIIGIYAADIFTDTYLGVIGVPFRYHGLYPDVVGSSFLVALFFGIIGAFIPAYNSSKVLPAEAMRLDPSVHLTKGGKSIIERLLQLFHIHLPIHVRMALRSIFRNRRRAWGTIIGISFSLMLILASVGMSDSMFKTIADIQKNETWDLRIQYNDFKAGSKIKNDIKKLQTWPEIETVESSIIFTTILTTNTSDEKIPVQLSIFHNNTVMHHFKFQRSHENFSDNGVVITTVISKKLDVKVGDKINVLHPTFNITQFVPKLEYSFELKNSTLTITGIVDEINGLNSFMTFNTVKKLVGIPSEEANFLYLRVKNPTKEQLFQLKSRIYEEIDGIQSVDTVKDLQDDWREYFDLMIFFISILVLFSFIIGTALVFNTILINVLERRREMATMRTLGDTANALTLQITFEHLILGVIGIIIGIPLGLMVMYEMFSLFDLEYFRLLLYISEFSYLITVSLIFLMIIAAEIHPTRTIFSLDLAEASKEIF